MEFECCTSSVFPVRYEISCYSISDFYFETSLTQKPSERVNSQPRVFCIFLDVLIEQLWRVVNFTNMHEFVNASLCFCNVLMNTE